MSFRGKEITGPQRAGEMFHLLCGAEGRKSANKL
jgi:hypothetical protein